MTINLLVLDINKHSQSWISLLSFNHKALLYIEWNYSKQITNIQVLFFFDWHKTN